MVSRLCFLIPLLLFPVPEITVTSPGGGGTPVWFMGYPHVVQWAAWHPPITQASGALFAAGSSSPAALLQLFSQVGVASSAPVDTPVSGDHVLFCFPFLVP